MQLVIIDLGEMADKSAGSRFGHLSECESGTKYRGTGCAESMVDKIVRSDFEHHAKHDGPKGEVQDNV